jgi:hypothetical protein
MLLDEKLIEKKEILEIIRNCTRFDYEQRLTAKEVYKML